MGDGLRTGRPGRRFGEATTARLLHDARQRACLLVRSFSAQLNIGATTR